MIHKRLSMQSVALILLFFLNIVDSYAQPVFESSSSNTGDAGDAVVNKPSGTIADNLLVVGVMFEKGSAETITPPSGWTLIRRTNNSTDCGMVTYYKVATSTEPATYSFKLDESSKWSIGCSRISAVNTITPVDVSRGRTGSGSTVIAPSLTTTSDDALILCFYTNKKDATYSAAGSTTERYDDPNSSGGLPSNMMATFTLASAGLSGNKSATASESEEWASQQIALNFGSSLPIELIEFSAKVNQSEFVELTWQTASESDNDFFTLESSSDGINWNEVKIINGAGNSSHRIDYVFLDVDPFLGVSYYRLKQTDFNGKYSYSKIESVQTNSTFSTQILVYPNPTQSSIIIYIDYLEIVSYQIFNLLGQDVTAASTIVDRTGSRCTIDLTGLSSGKYVLRIHGATAQILIE